MSPALPVDAHITNLPLAFNKQYPEITYELFEVNAAQLVELLNNGIIEVGIFKHREATILMFRSSRSPRTDDRSLPQRKLACA